MMLDHVETSFGLTVSETRGEVMSGEQCVTTVC